MLVCLAYYARNDIDDPLSATDLSSCIDLCMDRGIECMGVAFEFDYKSCQLKSKMMPMAQAAGQPQLWSAIRIGRPGSASPSTQLLKNGDFATELSPWVVSSDVIWENGAA